MPEPAFLFASVLASLVGFALFRYGRRTSRMPQTTVGLVLMVCPYFLPSALLVGVGSAVLLLGLWVVIRYGGL